MIALLLLAASIVAGGETHPIVRPIPDSETVEESSEDERELVISYRERGRRTRRMDTNYALESLEAPPEPAPES